MGKSLNGKELGKGITQRKSDGLYQGRFVNRFGKTQTIYAKTLNELRQRLRTEQYEDEKAINVVTKDITLDEWFEIWLNTYKKNCRNSTKESYAIHYRRIQKELGWRKLTSLNLIMVQNAINALDSDNERKNSKKILSDMLEKAIDADLLQKNVAKQVNTVITKEVKKERRVLTIKETELFLEKAQNGFYYNLYVLVLETGMRIGELCGLKWQDVDFEMHDTKTKNGRRTIPLTERAVAALKKQRIQKQKILYKGIEIEDEYRDLVFVTKNNRPTQQFLVQEGMNAVIKHVQEEYPEFERFSPHCFRHTFATRAIENGLQPKTLQKLLGHGSLQMTMDLYCHVTEDTLFEEMQKMAGIQAIATTSEDLLPDEHHSTISRDYEYKRLGTLSLLAGIDLQTGETIPLVSETHNSKDYIEFLKILDNKYPEGDKIRIVLDNLKVHTSEETRKYLATVPGRFEFVFTPKHGSWLNMVEGFFSKMTKQMLRGIHVKSKAELVDRIYLYFDEVDAEPVVFHWKYNFDDIDVSEEVIVDTLLCKKSG